MFRYFGNPAATTFTFGRLQTLPCNYDTYIRDQEAHLRYLETLDVEARLVVEGVIDRSLDRSSQTRFNRA